MNSNTFITDAEFEKEFNETKLVIISWKDLTIDTTYRIDNFTVKKTKYGIKTVLHLSTREGEKINVWSPDSLAKNLPKSIKKPTYVRSLGLKPHYSDPSKKYYAYKFLERQKN